MKQLKFWIFCIVAVSSYTKLRAEEERKVSFVGGARSLLTSNEIVVNDSIADTTTTKKNNGGYALIDLGLSIKPNKNTEIMGMFRIKNNFGGFWGAGVGFDVRQLWVKGIIANSIKYQLGDLNLKQTPFTLYNHHADQMDSLPGIFALQRNIVNYEKFYQNNSWRMQGANVDFGLSFSKIIKELNFSGFVTRLNATNFSSVPDRLMAGGRIDLNGNKIYKVGYTVNSVFDVKGTVPDSNVYNNTVHTVDIKLMKDFDRLKIFVAGETGSSSSQFSYDTLAPKANDYFVHAYTSAELKNHGITASLGYLNVGSDFHSIGAQSKDINYGAQPVFYNRYTNSQQIRPITMFDQISNDNLYSRTVSSKVMNENSLYNNALPYGLATSNRIGMYLKLNYTNNKKVNIAGEYYKLSEIKGQGTLALKKFDYYKVYVNLPINQWLSYNNNLQIQLSANNQITKRNSAEAVENIQLKTAQYAVGLRWEFVKNIELLGGFIQQQADGNEYAPDRNVYGEIVYYNVQKYNINQQLIAGGIRYNFSPKVYLCAFYQENNFVNKSVNQADFKLKQFAVLFNISL